MGCTLFIFLQHQFTARLLNFRKFFFVTIPHLTFLKILAASPIDCVMPLKFYIDKSVQPLLIFSATLYGSSSLYSSSVMLPCSLGSMYSK